MSLRELGGALLAIGLLATPAMAQTNQTNSNTNSNDTTSNSTSMGGLTKGMMSDRVQMTHGGYLSSKLVGATVYNDQKQSIGEIDNLIVDKNGEVSSAIISVGGFLGVGSKLVEVPFSRLQFQQDGNGNGREVILPNASQASLKSMQNFSYNS
jgi:sporulation protein YlmC with PRC-barrel domain